MNSNLNKKKSLAGKYTSNEQNVTGSEDDTFIDTLISQLPENYITKGLKSKDVMLYRLPDAEMNFENMCRTCLVVTNIKYSFDDVCDGVSIRTLLVQYASISVQEDMMPKHICEACLLELVHCYQFKTKCLQAQSTLKEIIKYSSTRQDMHRNENTIQIPFLLHNHEFTEYTADDKTTETKTGEEQETTISDPNFKEVINKPHKKEQEEITIQNKDYDCDLSSELRNLLKFETTDDMKVAIVNEKIKYKPPFYCFKCKQTFKSSEELGKHRSKLKHPKKKLSLHCLRCDQTFKTSEELGKHRKEVKHPKKRRKQQCPVCAKIITSHHLTLHMRTHTKEKPYVCEICSKAFSLNCNLRRHFMIHTGEKPYICDYCGKGFIQATTLSEHLCVHTGRKPLLCEICGRGFTQLSHLTDHKRIEHRINSFKCAYCDKVFSQILEYQNHLQNHQITNQEIRQQLKEHQCNVCEKVFDSTRLLTNHMRYHREKSYLCNHCGKGFCHNSSLESHLKVHTGEKPNSCPECGKSFSHVGSLKSHLLIHSGQKPFKCKICPKSFKQRGHLGCHMKTHSGEKSYKCSHCNKSFALNGTLRVHIRTHTGETPYVCDVCGRGFYHSSTMKKHRRRHDIVKNFNKTSSK